MKNGSEQLWTIEEVAEFLQIKPSVVKYWIYNDTIPYIKLGKYVRFERSEVLAWVKENKKQNNMLSREDLRQIGV